MGTIIKFNLVTLRNCFEYYIKTVTKIPPLSETIRYPECITTFLYSHPHHRYIIYLCLISLPLCDDTFEAFLLIPGW